MIIIWHTVAFGAAVAVASASSSSTSSTCGIVKQIGNKKCLVLDVHPAPLPSLTALSLPHALCTNPLSIFRPDIIPHNFQVLVADLNAPEKQPSVADHVSGLAYLSFLWVWLRKFPERRAEIMKELRNGPIASLLECRIFTAGSSPLLDGIVAMRYIGNPLESFDGEDLYQQSLVALSTGDEENMANFIEIVKALGVFPEGRRLAFLYGCIQAWRSESKGTFSDLTLGDVLGMFDLPQISALPVKFCPGTATMIESDYIAGLNAHIAFMMDLLSVDATSLKLLPVVQNYVRMLHWVRSDCKDNSCITPPSKPVTSLSAMDSFKEYTLVDGQLDFEDALGLAVANWDLTPLSNMSVFNLSCLLNGQLQMLKRCSREVVVKTAAIKCLRLNAKDLNALSAFQLRGKLRHLFRKHVLLIEDDVTVEEELDQQAARPQEGEQGEDHQATSEGSEEIDLDEEFRAVNLAFGGDEYDYALDAEVQDDYWTISNESITGDENDEQEMIPSIEEGCSDLPKEMANHVGAAQEEKKSVAQISSVEPSKLPANKRLVNLENFSEAKRFMNDLHAAFFLLYHLDKGTVAIGNSRTHTIYPSPHFGANARVICSDHRALLLIGKDSIYSLSKHVRQYDDIYNDNVDLSFSDEEEESEDHDGDGDRSPEDEGDEPERVVSQGMPMVGDLTAAMKMVRALKTDDHPFTEIPPFVVLDILPGNVICVSKGRTPNVAVIVLCKRSGRVVYNLPSAFSTKMYDGETDTVRLPLENSAENYVVGLSHELGLEEGLAKIAPALDCRSKMLLMHQYHNYQWFDIQLL